eukprot:g12129.t1
MQRRPALKILLEALPSAEEAEADDMVAAIGVLMCGPTETLTIPMETMVEPLVLQLRHESHILSNTVLEVLCDLVMASGPGGAVSPLLAKDARFVATLVRGLGARTPPQTVLRLCVLLQDAELTRPASAPYRSDRCFALAQ